MTPAEVWIYPSPRFYPNPLRYSVLEMRLSSILVHKCVECGDLKDKKLRTPCDKCGGWAFQQHHKECTQEEELLETLQGYAEMVLSREERYGDEVI